MKSNIALIIILLFATYCTQKDKGLKPKTTPEQVALDFFCDNLLHKKLFTDDDMILVPNSFDSAWLSNGLFVNNQLQGQEFALELTKPRIDSLTLLAQLNLMDDGERKEAIQFLTDFEKRRYNDTVKINLMLNKKIELGTYTSFAENTNDTSYFLKVMKHINSEDKIMVRLMFLKHGVPISQSFDIYVYMNAELKVIDWSF